MCMLLMGYLMGDNPMKKFLKVVKEKKANDCFVFVIVVVVILCRQRTQETQNAVTMMRIRMMMMRNNVKQ